MPPCSQNDVTIVLRRKRNNGQFKSSFAEVCFLPVQSNNTFFVESVSKNVFEENESISVSCHPETCLQGVAEIYCKESGWTPVPVCRSKQRQLHQLFVFRLLNS